jgi:spore germination protein PF
MNNMTLIFGGVDIQQVTGGMVSFGDAWNISPKNAVKDPSGAGSKNQGGWVFTTSGLSYTNYFDPDVSDQQIDDEPT